MCIDRSEAAQYKQFHWPVKIIILRICFIIKQVFDIFYTQEKMFVHLFSERVNSYKFVWFKIVSDHLQLNNGAHGINVR